MAIIEPVIRPPAEAGSFLLQLTLGCSADHCTFCGAYKAKPFRVKDPEEVFSDIERYARRDPGTRRVFLMDGDALVLSNSKLIPVLEKLEQSFPRLSRVSSYANGSNITRKNDVELAELSAHRLSLIYMGLESGSQLVLDRCGKTSGVEEMIQAVQRAEHPFVGDRPPRAGRKKAFCGTCAGYDRCLGQDAAAVSFVSLLDGHPQDISREGGSTGGFYGA